MPPTNLAPNKFQERLSGASRIQENLSAAVVLPRAPLGSLQRFHRHSSLFGGEGRGGAGCPLPKKLTPLLALSRPFGHRASALSASPLTKVPKIGVVAPSNMMGWIRLWAGDAK